MSLMMENTDQDCQLTLTEIRMRVANIKSQWSDEERVQRAAQGHSRRQRLAALVEEALPKPSPDSDQSPCGMDCRRKLRSIGIGRDDCFKLHIDRLP